MMSITHAIRITRGPNDRALTFGVDINTTKTFFNIEGTRFMPARLEVEYVYDPAELAMFDNLRDALRAQGYTVELVDPS